MGTPGLLPKGRLNSWTLESPYVPLCLTVKVDVDGRR